MIKKNTHNFARWASEKGLFSYFQTLYFLHMFHKKKCHSETFPFALINPAPEMQDCLASYHFTENGATAVVKSELLHYYISISTVTMFKYVFPWMCLPGFKYLLQVCMCSMWLWTKITFMEVKQKKKLGKERKTNNITLHYKDRLLSPNTSFNSMTKIKCLSTL